MRVRREAEQRRGQVLPRMQGTADGAETSSTWVLPTTRGDGDGKADDADVEGPGFGNAQQAQDAASPSSPLSPTAYCMDRTWS